MLPIESRRQSRRRLVFVILSIYCNEVRDTLRSKKAPTIRQSNERDDITIDSVFKLTE